MNLLAHRRPLAAITTAVMPAVMTALTTTLLLMLTTPTAQAQTAAPQAQAAKPAQFLYVLRLAPRFQTESAWTDAEKAAVGRHFQRLSEATQAGQVLLAGRTSEPLDKTFGLVIFEAENEAAARAFMEADPAVVAGLMTATLHPYSVALMRK